MFAAKPVVSSVCLSPPLWVHLRSGGSAMPNSHDIIILGSGSTAFAAALRACALGVRVLMVEKSVLGGTCINWGCIPSKTLIHAAQVYQNARHAARLGFGTALDAPDF